jgi:hypothetical protein
MADTGGEMSISRRGFHLLCALAGGALAVLVAAQATAASLADELVERLRMGFDAAGSEAEVEDLVLLGRFYQDRQLAPVWVSEQGATARAIALAPSTRFGTSSLSVCPTCNWLDATACIATTTKITPCSRPCSR